MLDTGNGIPVSLQPVRLPAELRERLYNRLAEVRVARCVLEDFEIYEQCQTQWCWAAVTTSVLYFFSAPTADPCLTQCQLVNCILDLEDCCLNGDSEDCNVPWPTNDPLDKLDLLEKYLPNVISFGDLKRELGGANCQDGRPVGCGLDALGSNASHAVVIAGWCEIDQKEKVWVCDPEGPDEDWFIYNDFLRLYHERWEWARTYRTKEP